MTTHPLDALSAYLDGDLDEATRAAVESHLAGCADCRGVVADLTAIRQGAAAWRHRDMAPARDLWPGIAARLTGPREVAPPVSSPDTERHAVRPVAWHEQRWSIGVAELAIAATVVAALGSALLWPRAQAPAPVAEGPVPIIAEADGVEVDGSQVVPANFADAQYNAAVGDLERVLLEQRDRLDPRTVVVLERNLRTIDAAIREAREALAADPANALLNAYLAGARQRKLDLLRRAALITEGD